MIPIQKLADVDTQRFLNRAQAVDPTVAATAADIIAAVQREGDAALRHYTETFDGIELDNPLLSAADWQEGAAQCPPAVRAAIDANLARIHAFHARQVPRPDEFTVEDGVKLGRRPVPLAAAGCYVPGGRAAYPSTVLMTVTPAKLAGVQRIVIVTPPRTDGTVDPAVLYAAQVAGATDIVRAGGAQAIAALALGTSTIQPVDCIVGPGNAYVTAAKQQLQSHVRIDSPAGPSELLVIADATANPAWIAADLVAQAEHDPDAQCILVATDHDVAAKVATELDGLARAAPRADVVQASLRDHGAVLVASLPEAVDFANAYAAEHLEIHTANPADVASQIHNAGSIFIGAHAPVPLGDYGSGTNHVLPTMGHARTRGGLAVDDFCKWITWQQVTPEGLRNVASDIVTLARAEGLDSHADAVEARL